VTLSFRNLIRLQDNKRLNIEAESYDLTDENDDECACHALAALACTNPKQTYCGPSADRRAAIRQRGPGVSRRLVAHPHIIPAERARDYLTVLKRHAGSMRSPKTNAARACRPAGLSRHSLCGGELAIRRRRSRGLSHPNAARL
jgi:hypothetical protein